MSILFVDDEKQVLRGLERMLDGTDLDWDVEFALSGAEALEMLAEDDEIDTLVTDMKMPGMDGATLLQKVSQRFPHLVRIVLSGQADKEAVFRAVNPMHQYLTKPCDAVTLTTTIQRARALRDVLMSDELQRVVGRISQLPSPPKVYNALMEKIRDKESSIESIGKIIAQDPAMTAKILQIANSAIFGLKAPVTSAARAATFLGIETIKSLVLSVGVFKEFVPEKSFGFSFEGMMNHGLKVASCSRKIGVAENLDQDQIDTAFTAGVIHDIGKLVLMTFDLDGFRETVRMAKFDEIPSWKAEQEVFGVHHASVGGHILSMWGIPQSIVEVVALHHHPHNSGEVKCSPLTAVSAANQICRKDSTELFDTPYYDSFKEYLASVGCEKKMDGWRSLCAGPAEDSEVVQR